ncbi:MULTISPECIES: homocysteine S-methyltransferase [Mycobacteriaceae]|uniref:homocysteine S-methyltransferase n=1 Tax=Mycobacteriaceae TaxID=1762 RepID=UPI00105C5C23|nr:MULTISPECIES: homocysteine S-methyltransferase [Mycobacteriaceae]
MISDGGLATELEARGHDLSDDLWSARLLVDSPQEIVAVHEAFYRAGADIATTASYQASFDGFAERGFAPREAEQLLIRSVDLARTARDNVGGEGWVAASVGPYGAALANGEEYVGRYGLTVAQLADWHRRRLEVLVSAEPDILALETVPDVDEAEALAGLVREYGIPAWLSYTIADGRTRAGQSLEEAFAVAADVPEIVAVGINCSAPAEVFGAIEVARRVTDKAVIVYPNSGEEWDGRRRTWVGTGGFDANAATQWAAAGANIIGGCCRVSPADIAAIRRSGPTASGTPEPCR